MNRVPQFPAFVRALPEIVVPIEGVRGWTLQGSAQQAVFLEFTDRVDVPEHSHSAQWEIVVAGQVDLRVGGRTTTYRAGDNFYIAAGVPHGATVHAGYQTIIIFDEPERYRVKA